MTTKPYDGLLLDWLEARTSSEFSDWLRCTVETVGEIDDARLERALAIAGRKVGKAALNLTTEELERADAISSGWAPVHWTLADAARAYVLCVLAAQSEDFGVRFKRLCQTADLASLIGLYRATPVFPYDEDVDWQLGEGLRTSIGAIFEAIAHDNPVPASEFSEHRWNHMVLKALFIDSRLPPILGLDRRRNRALSETLVDHVHERRAAGRAVNYHVWRCIAPFAEGPVLNEILPLVGSGERVERQVAALFLAEIPDPAARGLLGRLPEERGEIASGALDWSAIPG